MLEQTIDELVDVILIMLFGFLMIARIQQQVDIALQLANERPHRYAPQIPKRTRSLSYRKVDDTTWGLEPGEVQLRIGEKRGKGKLTVCLEALQNNR